MQDAILRRRLPRVGSCTVYVVWWREGLLRTVSGAGFWTPRRGVADTSRSVDLSGVKHIQIVRFLYACERLTGSLVRLEEQRWGIESPSA